MPYAIVEMMGRRAIAGLAEEAVRAGAPVLRVTVPAWSRERTIGGYLTEPDPISGAYGQVERTVREDHAAYVCEVGGASIYCVTWCSELRVMETLQAGGCHDGGAVVRTEEPWRPYRSIYALPVLDGDDDPDADLRPEADDCLDPEDYREPTEEAPAHQESA